MEMALSHLKCFNSVSLAKYYILNLFKEMAISFDHALQTTLESPANLSKSLLFKLVNAALILAFSSSLVLHGVFWPLTQLHP